MADQMRPDDVPAELVEQMARTLFSVYHSDHGDLSWRDHTEQAAVSLADLLPAHEAKVRADERHQVAEEARALAGRLKTTAGGRDAACLRWFADRLDATNLSEEDLRG